MYGHAVISANMLAMVYLLLMLALPACNACSECHWIPQHVNYMAPTLALDNDYDNSHGNFIYNNSWTNYSSLRGSSICHKLPHIP